MKDFTKELWISDCWVKLTCVPPQSFVDPEMKQQVPQSEIQLMLLVVLDKEVWNLSTWQT